MQMHGTSSLAQSVDRFRQTRIPAVSAIVGRSAPAVVQAATNSPELFERDHMPGVGNRRLLRRSKEMMNQMRQANPGLVVLAEAEIA
jgi:hypothetical protein